MESQSPLDDEHTVIFSAKRAKWRSLMRRVREVGPGGVGLLIEAFVLLAMAKAALACVPVAKVIGWKQRELRRERASNAESLRKIRHAVLVAARYSPVEF